MGRSSHVALDLPECELTGRVNVASVTAAEYVETRFRVTQIRELACAEEGLDPVTGLVFDECHRRRTADGASAAQVPCGGWR